jgi:hypothetical protein
MFSPTIYMFILLAPSLIAAPISTGSVLSFPPAPSLHPLIYSYSSRHSYTSFLQPPPSAKSMELTSSHIRAPPLSYTRRRHPYPNEYTPPMSGQSTPYNAQAPAKKTPDPSELCIGCSSSLMEEGGLSSARKGGIGQMLKKLASIVLQVANATHNAFITGSPYASAIANAVSTATVVYALQGGVAKAASHAS